MTKKCMWMETSEPDDTPCEEPVLREHLCAAHVRRLADNVAQLVGTLRKRLGEEQARLRALIGDPPVEWTANVEKMGGGAHRTMFRVGSQGFQLAYVEGSGSLLHALFIQNLFVHALYKLGVTSPLSAAVVPNPEVVVPKRRKKK